MKNLQKEKNEKQEKIWELQKELHQISKIFSPAPHQK